MEIINIAIICIIIIMAVACFLIGKKIIERRIENIINEKKTLLPFEIREYNYSIFSRTLVLYNVNFEYAFKNDAKDSILLSAKKVVIKNLNPLLGRMGEGIPKVFRKMTVHELQLVLKSDDNPRLSMYVEKYTVWKYAHNIFKHIQEYKENPLSEEFFSSVLNVKHNGVEKSGTLFTFHSKGASQEKSLFIKRAYLYPMNNIRHLSLLYEDIVWNPPIAMLKSKSVKMDDISMPSPKTLSEFAINFQKKIGSSDGSIWQKTFFWGK